MSDDYDALTVKLDPANGFYGVEWRGLFIYHGLRDLCREFSATFTEKLNQVKMERSGFDTLPPGDYLVRKGEGTSHMAWLLRESKIALDNTPVFAAHTLALGESIHTKLDTLEYLSREDESEE